MPFQLCCSTDIKIYLDIKVITYFIAYHIMLLSSILKISEISINLKSFTHTIR